MSAVTEALNMMEMNIDLYADYDFVDDVSNIPLETDRAIAARRFERQLCCRMKLRNKMLRSEAQGNKITSTRRLGFNKGDGNRPDYRARLVGRELKLKDRRLYLFASTPPLNH